MKRQERQAEDGFGVGPQRGQQVDGSLAWLDLRASWNKLRACLGKFALKPVKSVNLRADGINSRAERAFVFRAALPVHLRQPGAGKTLAIPSQKPNFLSA
ncbi:hypothetical protein [Geomicrobium sp. JCM 19037]|uniref:hypothetical protein n=1 Tax=Geomicrobium sp. JCM 19037 TaxID=1460634 RepID=UPI0005A70A15|nr:hypothetical protein [Geomicrobium sp. JCM 19037]